MSCLPKPPKYIADQRRLSVEDEDAPLQKVAVDIGQYAELPNPEVNRVALPSSVTDVEYTQAGSSNIASWTNSMGLTAGQKKSHRVEAEAVKVDKDRDRAVSTFVIARLSA